MPQVLSQRVSCTVRHTECARSALNLCERAPHEALDI